MAAYGSALGELDSVGPAVSGLNVASFDTKVQKQPESYCSKAAAECETPPSDKNSKTPNSSRITSSGIALV